MHIIRRVAIQTVPAVIQVEPVVHLQTAGDITMQLQQKMTSAKAAQPVKNVQSPMNVSLHSVLIDWLMNVSLYSVLID